MIHIFKKNYSNWKTLAHVFLFFLLGLFYFNCSKDRQVVAVFDGGVVTFDDFLNDYRNYLTSTGIRDNMTSRKLILDEVINEKIIFAEFKKNNMSKSVDFKAKTDIIYEQLLLNRYYEEVVLQSASFSDKQLYQFFARENKLYHIKQVFADNYEIASQYYEMLKNGMSFGELVESKKIPDIKVDLGFVSINEVHPQFRKNLEKLSVGEISEPLRGKYGYTILKIEDKMVRPVLTENEFASQKKMLAKKMSTEYSDSLQNDYIVKMKRDISIVWNEKNLRQLFEIIKRVNTKEDLPILDDLYSISNEEICKVDGESFSYFTLLPIILKSKIEQIKAARDIGSLKDLVTGALIRERIVEQAKSRGLDRKPEFQELFTKKNAKLKIDYWIQSFSDTVRFSDADYEYFYNANKSGFVLPVRRQVYEICTLDKSTAQSCVERFKNGEKFQQIAEEFMRFHQKKSRDGYLGILISEELGMFGTSVFSTPLGEITGPFKYGDHYYLFLATKEYASRPLAQDEAKPLIEKKYRQDLIHRRMASFFDYMAKKYHVQKKLEILKSIEY